MRIIQVVTENMFVNEMSREVHGFSYAGAAALFDYFEEYEVGGAAPDDSDNVEFDPVGIRCTFSEYNSLEEVIEDYRLEDDTTVESLQELTTVIEIPKEKGLIIADF